MAITSPMPLINGVAYTWADITCSLNGLPVNGITSIEYGDTQSVTDHYGAGRYPVARSRGKVTTTAKITLPMSEVVAIQRIAPKGRLQDLAAFDITISYLPNDGSNPELLTVDKIKNCQFKSNSRASKADDDDKQIVVEFELIASHIEWNAYLV